MKENEERAQNSERLMTIREAADLLNVSERTVWNLTNPRGDIPCVRIGSALRYEQGSLRQWLERKLNFDSKSESNRSN